MEANIPSSSQQAEPKPSLVMGSAIPAGQSGSAVVIPKPVYIQGSAETRLGHYALSFSSSTLQGTLTYRWNGEERHISWTTRQEAEDLFRLMQAYFILTNPIGQPVSASPVRSA